MTIALLIKVNDGLVLASDSATTLSMRFPEGSESIANTYNNANKVFNLHKGIPVGGMTWGLGNIGPASIATLAKDLRRRFSEPDGSGDDWTVDPQAYEIEALAQRARTFLYGGRYHAIEQAAATEGYPAPALGFLVAGYSSGSDEPCAHVINLGVAGSPEVEEVLPNDTGAAWWGQPEAISRLLLGLSLGVPEALVNLNVGLDPEQAREVVVAI